jgi:hypothetical protein
MTDKPRKFNAQSEGEVQVSLINEPLEPEPVCESATARALRRWFNAGNKSTTHPAEFCQTNRTLPNKPVRVMNISPVRTLERRGFASATPVTADLLAGGER